MANNEGDLVPKEVKVNNEVDRMESPPPPATPPPENEDTQELIVVDENTELLDLNHGRIGKIENLEPLRNLER